MKFKEWLKIKESYLIVTCKDLKNPNFQVQGALSDLNCKNKRKKKSLTKH